MLAPRFPDVRFLFCFPLPHVFFSKRNTPGVFRCPVGRPTSLASQTAFAKRARAVDLDLGSRAGGLKLLNFRKYKLLLLFSSPKGPKWLRHVN